MGAEVRHAPTRYIEDRERVLVCRRSDAANEKGCAVSSGEHAQSARPLADPADIRRAGPRNLVSNPVVRHRVHHDRRPIGTWRGIRKTCRRRCR